MASAASPHLHLPMRSASAQVDLNSENDTWQHDWLASTVKDLVGCLTLKTWTLHMCSPLHNFIPAQCRFYCQTLVEYLNSQLEAAPPNPFSLAQSEIHTSTWFRVETVTVHHVTDLDPQLGSCLYFTIRYVTQTQESDKRHTATCHLVMMAPENVDQTSLWTTFVQAGKTSHTVSLPLVLFKGPSPLKDLLLRWLQFQFDCRISVWSLAQHQLQHILVWWNDHWLNRIASLPPYERDEIIRSVPRPFELQYTFPDAIPQLRKVSLSLPLSTVVSLWQRIRTQRLASSTTTILEVLEAHAQHNLAIRFGQLRLEQFGCGTACLTANGKLKLFDPSQPDQVVAWLVELCHLLAS
ncbi:hypothetical protein IWQ62_005288 [Dispira parvispora]|uniref:Centromere protein L n=1 Tax=Dispira parvispora TaxID=1520584 RepID=A0A9W8E164_9FUNG|nr:hypothetical protein IWQ62_005288 [Dispira parvispora]